MQAVDNKQTVLVVDDHRFSRTVLTRILEAAGYDVATAESGERGLELMETTRPDALIVDVEMPGMSGIELCRRLREDPANLDLPIVIITALEDSALLRSAFDAGCDDFLQKPLEPLVVTVRLKNLIAKAEYHRQLERVRRNLARYISPRIRQVVESTAASGNLPPPEEQEVCILFSDIRGFTALSQTISPSDLFSAVSHHLGCQVESVYRFGGYVDKFGGDGIMAVFDGSSMARNACHCALEIMNTASDGAIIPFQPVPLGIGIHMGPVVAGNIGSGEHLDYSVIGNTVNLAARLCGYALSMDIVVSEAVYRRAASDPELFFTAPRKTRIRGLREAIMLYNLNVGREAVSN